MHAAAASSAPASLAPDLAHSLRAVRDNRRKVNHWPHLLAALDELHTAPASFVPHSQHFHTLLAVSIELRNRLQTIEEQLHQYQLDTPTTDAPEQLAESNLVNLNLKAREISTPEFPLTLRQLCNGIKSLGYEPFRLGASRATFLRPLDWERYLRNQPQTPAPDATNQKN